MLVGTADGGVVHEEDVTTVEGFHDLYLAAAGDVYRYLAQRVGRDAAEDLLADVFLVAWTKREALTELAPGRETAWLIGVARNVARHHARTDQRKLRAIARLPIEISDGGIADDAADRVDAVGRSARVQHTMSDDERWMVARYVDADGAHQQVADDLGVPVGTVKSRMSRMRERLQRTHEGPRDAR